MHNQSSDPRSTHHYVSKPVNSNGTIDWSDEENAIWHHLVTRQLECIQGKACDEYLAGLSELNLPHDYIPQLKEINRVLLDATGWQCVAVPALISFDRFFSLLSRKQFPVATFIRTRADIDYLQEPDFFHEIFGHCAMLTNPYFAQFTHFYGKLGAKATPEERVYLARLYWFTVEFGLLNQNGKYQIYGGGILSSPQETVYAATSEIPQRVEFDPVEVMRTPYRIDILQPKYFVLQNMEQLYQVTNQDIFALVAEAQRRGLRAPMFENKEIVNDEFR
ncbi:phenylalanine 4-monooxygenase [Photobacterium leiognathi]|uniref:Phenylalanine-4-hydroxylase n=3 Tax=Photobacterium leiognathi TaxID=553611 RepID=V5H488_PHOLE|nr:phenylalanine 4-monooxygenase [Photobacterium leiognathi]MCG3884222.1 phenylalanine 4-monooxygenase [Photobacterium leiognathi]GAA06280.1 phenylalanine-4-hydroxylase [Photobacterium leiognathi subsp. mandapamensis svers.1.1.]GAD31857.1 phenylalanine-4-hydroxylase [Photobacterium leiognathi lrivu.4.1]